MGPLRSTGFLISIESNHYLQFCQWQQQTEQRLWGVASFKPRGKAFACNPNTQDLEAEGFSQVWGHLLPWSEILSRLRGGLEGKRSGRKKRRWLLHEVEARQSREGFLLWLRWQFGQYMFQSENGHMTWFTTHWIKSHNPNPTIRKYKITLCQNKELELNSKPHWCMSHEAYSTQSLRILILPSEHGEEATCHHVFSCVSLIFNWMARSQENPFKPSVYRHTYLFAYIWGGFLENRKKEFCKTMNHQLLHIPTIRPTLRRTDISLFYVIMLCVDNRGTTDKES